MRALLTALLIAGPVLAASSKDPAAPAKSEKSAQRPKKPAKKAGAKPKAANVLKTRHDTVKNTIGNVR